MSVQHHDPSYNPAIHVLRISDNGTPPYVVLLDATVYEDSISGHTSASTKGLEKVLGYVPDLKRFKDYFDIRYRELFDMDMNVGNLDAKTYGQHYVYKCIKENIPRLPKNKSFHHTKDARVYGDMFVFKVEVVEEIEGQSRPMFGEMVEFERGLRHEGPESRLVKQMAKW